MTISHTISMKAAMMESHAALLQRDLIKCYITVDLKLQGIWQAARSLLVNFVYHISCRIVHTILHISFSTLFKPWVKSI